MINQENFHFYLRYLVKISDEKPISYDEIPKEFQNFFTIPALSQALNISLNQPSINWSKVENYINTNSFINFDSLVDGINSNFKKLTDKLYAAYFFVANNIDYDEVRNSSSSNKSVSIDDIIKTKKGLQMDYIKTFFELAKKIGFTSNTIQIAKFHNASNSWDALDPPSEPSYNYTSILLNIDGESFISQPYLGAGYWKNSSFCKEYRKFYFLIPYYRYIMSYFPEANSITPTTYPFTWENFTSLSKPDLLRELSFESNPYKIIDVSDGYNEFQFSFVHPNPSLLVDLYFKEGDTFKLQNSRYLSISLLEKDIPNHYYSAYSDEKRCRYKITTVFPKKGSWIAKIFNNRLFFFQINFEVKKTTDALIDIPSYDKDEPHFIPVTPLQGLTNVEHGYARIRFAVKMKRSQLLIKLFKIKPGTFDRDSDEMNGGQYFTLELPSDFNNETSDPQEKLVEDWILVQFPENGRFEVYIYFKNDQGTYSYGVTYYFDVKGAENPSNKIEYAIFDVPKDRVFIPFKPNTTEKIWAEPSSSIEIINELDYFFHVFSKDPIKVYFQPIGNEEKDTVWPQLIQTKDTENEDIKDREYSVTFPSNGQYELDFWGEKYLGSQLYIVNESFQFIEETETEKKLMRKFKNKVNGIIEYNDDIPVKIQKDVELMIVDAEGQKDERLEMEEKERKKKEKEREKRREKLLKEREDEDRIEREKDEKEKKEKEERKRKEMEEIEKFEKEVNLKAKKNPKKASKNQMKSDSQSEIEFLKQKTSKLEKEKETFKLRFEELEKKEDEMRKEFLLEIEGMRKAWAAKEQEEEKQLSKRNQKIEEEELEEEQRIQKETEKRIQELRQRIKAIEIQLEFDPNKRKELVNLHEQLKSEEENDIIINSARAQKRLERSRQEEREKEARKTNAEYQQRKYISAKENEFIKSVRDEEEKFRAEREKMRERIKQSKNKAKPKIELDEFEEDESDDDDDQKNDNKKREFESFEEDESEDDDQKNENEKGEFELSEDDESEDEPNPEFEIEGDDEVSSNEEKENQIKRNKPTTKNIESALMDQSTSIKFNASETSKTENPSEKSGKSGGGNSNCCLLI